MSDAAPGGDGTAGRVKFDGRCGWEREVDFSPGEVRVVYFGAKPMGCTGREVRFTETILEVVRGGKPDSVR